MTGNDKDGRDDGGQCRIRCHGRTDVHPAECDHLQRAADDDACRHIAEDETCECAGDERAMGLQFIQDGTHASYSRHDENRENLQAANLHDLPLHLIIAMIAFQ